MMQARQQHLALLHAQPLATSLSMPWTAVGPMQVNSPAYGNVTGRVNAIAMDPSDTSGNTVYLGTLGGGIWKSTNAGGSAASVSFAPLTDTLPVFNANAGSSQVPSLSIGAISVQPGGTGVILAGTGDPNDALDSYYGSGILRSADNGLTWSVVANSQDGVAGNHTFLGMGFAGFAWNATSPNIVVAATGTAAQSALVGASPSNYVLQGLYYSTDAGVTWKAATIKDGSAIVQQPSTTSVGNAATSVVWNPLRGRFYAAIRFHGYYESADGQTWTRLTNQPGSGLSTAACPALAGNIGSSACPIFRGTLAVEPVTGDMYALTTNSNNIDQGLWRDLCSVSGSTCGNTTVSFAQQINTAVMETTGQVIPSADYNVALAAVPSGGDTLLYVGTQDIFRCGIAAGCTLRNTTNTSNGCGSPARVAAFQHSIAWQGSVLYFANDSGLWRSTDGIALSPSICSADDANHFQNLNSGLGSLAEVVGFAQHPTDANTLLIGMGANGSAATSNASAMTAWPQLSAGEGGMVAMDQASPSRWMVSTGAGVNLVYCNKGSACAASDFATIPTIGAAQTLNDGALIHAPFFFDPQTPANLIVGTCRVWRGPADSGALWSSSNALSSTLGGNASTCGAANAYLRTLSAGGANVVATSAANTGSQVLYAGMASQLDGGGITLGGHIFTTASANTAGSSTVWTDITNGINAPGFAISRVYVDSHDATGKTVYVTVAGFSSPLLPTGHVYRSTDGGAHWSNLTANLPNAPANDILVDPNDARTLYVALDTGVYIAPDSTTCTSTNCWSVYGAGLPNAPAMALAAATQMPTGSGGNVGMLRVATYGRGIWQTPLRTALPPAVRGMQVAPGSLSFADTQVTLRSADQSVVVTNTGNVALNISAVAMQGDFVETDNCTTAPIAVAGSCSLQVLFAPTVMGARSGLMTLYADIPGGQATVSLSGNGLAPPAVVLSPVAAAFAATNIGSSSAVTNFTVSNTGGVSVSLQTPVVTRDFAIVANTCGSSLSPQTGCTVSVVFRPTSSGTRSGVLTVVNGIGTQTASLSGIGVSPATDALSPLSLTFAAQQMNTASAAQTVQLTNDGDAALTLITAQITRGDFTAVNSCGNSLAGHSSCSIQVSFVPRSIGAQTGVLTVSDLSRTQTVALNGTGIAPPGVSLAPASPLAFGAIGVGLASSAQTITLTNNGGVPLLINGTTLSGDFAILAGSNTCPAAGATLAAGAACTMNLVFAPKAVGTRTGALSIADNATGAPHVLQLTGTGVDFSLSASGSTTATLSSGGTATYATLLSSDSALSGAVTLTCSGQPSNSTCVLSPSNATLGNSTLITITIATGVKAMLAPPFAKQLLWLALLVPAWRLRRRVAAMSLLLCLCAVMLNGCGWGRKLPDTTSNPPTSTNPTPSGTYTIAVTATAAGLSRTVNYTLTVK
ncbi:choice-of-anchor D domain-containing protein [Terriglobus tenax]|uniref:choice-of-anchor D domain-containing protein n=1 Tax=Terriglobus tenax TaxID=1111115 RepID=UPI0021E039F1|nr:choice-of-anchor D domain-containing protein [Terriglobus tenax]